MRARPPIVLLRLVRPSPLAARLLVAAVAALSLLPPARLASDWLTYTRVVGRPLEATPPLGFDGVRWADRDGEVVAAFVLPGSPAHRAGVRTGDRLRRLDYLPVREAADVRATTERATGTVQTYSLLRSGGAGSDVDVPIVRAPTFVYPMSTSLWAAAAWGFGLAALVHVLALATVLPLARRSRRAQRAAWLVGAATAWVAGNLLRIAWVTLDTPGLDAPWARAAFDALTLVAVAGWIAFPALLLRGHLVARPLLRAAVGRAWWLLAAPPLLLGAGLAVATVAGHIGPLPPNAFVVPVVFYVCVYVGAASALALASPPVGAPRPWLRAGHGIVLAVATVGAVVAWRLAPTAQPTDSVAVGWIVTALQLLSALPVVLVSADTLRVGAFDVVLARGAGQAALLAAVFATVVGGEALLGAAGGASPVALGALVVGVLATAQALAPRVARAARRLARRPDARAALDAFAERMRDVLDAGTLAQTAAEAVGRAFDPRSAAVFLRDPADPAQWVRAAWRPSPPTFGEAELMRVWGVLRTGGRVWARNDEINEADLPPRDADHLRRLGVALAVPVADGDGEAVGLIVLARRARALAVYSVADVARLRGLAGQLALAAERLRLVEREKALVRQTAEAELVALRAQINPHFLFNALNTVASLIAERPAEAEQTVESLAGLFRDVLTASGRPFVPLSDELRLVRRYLSVETARFGDALDVTVEATPDALGRDVPAFAVQTLVENAVKHGVERQRGGGSVRVTAHVDEADALVVEVSDTGVGIPALFADGIAPLDDAPGISASPSAPGDPMPAFFGVGLSNVARRLGALAPDGTPLTLASSPEGTTATLTIPAR